MKKSSGGIYFLSLSAGEAQVFDFCFSGEGFPDLSIEFRLPYRWLTHQYSGMNFHMLSNVHSFPITYPATKTNSTVSKACSLIASDGTIA